MGLHEDVFGPTTHMAEDHLRKGQEVPVFQSLVAGCLSGISARIVTAPLDTLKIRLQLQLANEAQYGGILVTFKRLVRQEGVRALWKGNVPAMAMYILYGSTQFTSYAILNKLLSKSQLPAQIHTGMVGALSGTCSAIASYPCDVLRTRFIANHSRELSTMLSTAQEIWRHEGFRGFFKGVSSSIVSIAVATSSILATYESVKIFCEQRPDRDSSVIQLLESSASVIAGIVSKTIVFPIDTVRKRYQVIDWQQLGHPGHTNKAYKAYKSYTSTNFLRLALMIVEKEGLLALYHGYTLGIAKSVPSTVVSLGVYEWCLRRME